jgi:hypothetical protein
MIAVEKHEVECLPCSNCASFSPAGMLERCDAGMDRGWLLIKVGPQANEAPSSSFVTLSLDSLVVCFLVFVKCGEIEPLQLFPAIAVRSPLRPVLGAHLAT